MNTSPRNASQAQSPSSHLAPTRPGSMTAVMRTLAVGTGPRIPRIAVVRNGRILDEHLIRDASARVTIGTSERSLIVVRNAPTLPASFELLERVGDRYFLRFTDAMTGRVTNPATGISSLQELRSIAHASNGAYRIPLAEDARGKVIVGDTTFLFQLVVRPPIAPRPRLPLSVKNSIGLDWTLTIIAAFSFLLHFGIAGAMYSDWMDPVVATDHTVSGFVDDDVPRLLKPTPEVSPTTKDESTTTAPPTPAPVVDNNNNNDHHAKPVPSPVPPQPQPQPHNNNTTSDSQAARLMAQAEQLEVDKLTVNANGSSVEKALRRSEIPAVDLSKAAEKNIGIAHNDTGDLTVHSSGNPIVKKSGLPGLLADNTHNTSTDKAGTDTPTTGPVISVDTPPLNMNGVINDADSVIAKLRPRFRKCYQDGLLNDPSMSGKAVIVAKIGPNGEVQSTSVGSNEGLSSGVTSCLQNVVGRATFTGNGTATTMRIPITMLKQQPR